MRTLRTATLILTTLALAAGSATMGLAKEAKTDGAVDPITHVTGSLDVDWLPGGTFDVQDRVFQYRRVGPGNWVQEIAFPKTNAPLATPAFADDFAVAGTSLAIADSDHSVPETASGAIFAFDIQFTG